MSTNDDNGGPAFPVSSEAFKAMVAVVEALPAAQREAMAERIAEVSRGMTLRDYFAAKAMQGICANPGAAFQANDRTGWGLVNAGLDEIANLSYDMADAMLKARKS